jgi:hypothetical protein
VVLWRGASHEPVLTGGRRYDSNPLK